MVTGHTIPWWVFHGTLLDARNNLAQPVEIHGTNPDAESSNVTEAAAQIVAYDTAGLRDDLTAAETDDALRTISDLESAILSDPVQFSDPVWPEYLKTLDAMRTEVEGAIR